MSRIITDNSKSIYKGVSLTWTVRKGKKIGFKWRVRVKHEGKTIADKLFPITEDGEIEAYEYYLEVKDNINKLGTD